MVYTLLQIVVRVVTILFTFCFFTTKIRFTV